MSDIKHTHRCMRCNETFECQTPAKCRANYEVIPNIVTEDGDGIHISPHCPEKPTWDWIRAYGKRKYDEAIVDVQKAENQIKAALAVSNIRDSRIANDGETMASLKAENERLTSAARNLMAVINRDGGQKSSMFASEVDALKAAEAEVVTLLERAEAAESRAEKMREALQEIINITDRNHPVWDRAKSALKDSQ